MQRMQSFSVRRKVLFDACNITTFTPTDWSAEEYSEAREG